MPQIDILGLPILVEGLAEPPLTMDYIYKMGQSFSFDVGLLYWSELNGVVSGPTGLLQVTAKITEANNQLNFVAPKEIKPDVAPSYTPVIDNLTVTFNAPENYNSLTEYNTLGTTVTFAGKHYKLVALYDPPQSDTLPQDIGSHWVEILNNKVTITLPNDLAADYTTPDYQSELLPVGNRSTYGILDIIVQIAGFDPSKYLGKFYVPTGGATPTKSWDGNPVGVGTTFYNTFNNTIWRVDGITGGGSPSWNPNWTPTGQAQAATAFVAARGLIKFEQYVPGNDVTADVSATTQAIAEFSKIYLGAKASDPTVDNNGNTLIVGALYLNTTIGQLMVCTSISPVTWEDTKSTGAYAPINNPTFTGLVTVPAGLTVQAQDGGDEGAEINLTKPVNSSFAGNIAVDIYQNKIRIFEAGGNYRGLFLDLGSWGDNITTEIWHQGNLNPDALSGIQPVNVTAAEDLLQGDFVNIFYTGGNRYCQKAACYSGLLLAHGFVKSNVTNGQAAAVYPGGINIYASGTFLDETVFLSATPGLATTTVPTTSGYIVQEIGVATGPNSIYFQYNPPIKLA